MSNGIKVFWVVAFMAVVAVSASQGQARGSLPEVATDH
ncbi:hypothetical protein SAMN05444339_10651 [Loktanella atrilutea]|uniref:Uncharacterized protein n=1 Tax=Loktanella atrilutea TaxID=366533 RepID=A0A1M5BKH7_LOKAT|nr:hypothetical protein SAMN05444339_10651 [Loktanella atrilutea]